MAQNSVSAAFAASRTAKMAAFIRGHKDAHPGAGRARRKPAAVAWS